MSIFLIKKLSNQGISVLKHSTNIYYLLESVRQSNNSDPGLTLQCLINIDDSI